MSNPVSELGLSNGTASDGMPLDSETELETIYRAEFPWLVRFFRRRLNSAEDAQDLAHETMLRFMRTAPTRELTIPQAYLRRIATNLARDHAGSGAQRLAQRMVPLIEGLDVEAGVDQHQIIASRDELAAWEAILSKLKPRTLEIFRKRSFLRTLAVLVSGGMRCPPAGGGHQDDETDWAAGA